MSGGATRAPAASRRRERSAGRWCVAVALCLAVAACSSPADEPERGAEPDAPAEVAADPPTVEEYVVASHEACERYLGALFSMAKADEELDSTREDASEEFFLRRADDIAQHYADYRAEVVALQPPADEDVQAAHDQIVELMGAHREAIAAVGDAAARGDVEEARARMVEASLREDEVAAVQDSVGIRPCGR